MADIGRPTNFETGKTMVSPIASPVKFPNQSTQRQRLQSPDPSSENAAGGVHQSTAGDPIHLGYTQR